MAAISTPEAGKQKAGDIKETIARQARSLLDDQKGKLVKRLETLASAIRQIAGQLEEQEAEKPVSAYLHAASGKVEQVSGYLSDRDVEELLEDARKQIRKRPALALGGAFVTGFVLARLLKNARGLGDEGR